MHEDTKTLLKIIGLVLVMLSIIFNIYSLMEKRECNKFEQGYADGIFESGFQEGTKDCINYFQQQK